jgi:PAS domain-containing protein
MPDRDEAQSGRVISGSRSLMDFLQTPVLVGDPDGRVVYVNSSFETDFLVSVDEIVGQPMANLFDGGGREAVLRAVADVCDERSPCDAARFALLVQDRGYKAIVSAVETDGGRVGVILLLTREAPGEKRLQGFRREVLAALDELTGCLATLAEYADGEQIEAQHQAIADGVRCIERLRKWAGAVASALDGGVQGSALTPAAADAGPGAG